MGWQSRARTPCSGSGLPPSLLALASARAAGYRDRKIFSDGGDSGSGWLDRDTTRGPGRPEAPRCIAVSLPGPVYQAGPTLSDALGGGRVSTLPGLSTGLAHDASRGSGAVSAHTTPGSSSKALRLSSSSSTS